MLTGIGVLRLRLKSANSASAAGTNGHPNLNVNWRYLATCVFVLARVFCVSLESKAGETIWTSAGSEASGAAASAPAKSEAASPWIEESWAIRGQATLVPQGNFRFRSPYQGPNSLNPRGQVKETFDFTLYAGIRPWSGGEIWVNPEIDQGFGLSSTLGVAGFPNGEAYKVGAVAPYPKLHRAFFRQTISLGGETEKVDPDLNQLGGTRTADRLVLTIGKFSVVDVFDTNRYAHDPRTDFLNWALIDTGTFDYAANAWGYTYGAALEWYQDVWTLRGGVFDLSLVPNSKILDPRFEQFQTVLEIERRHELWGAPGKLKVTSFLSRGRMGRFQDAIRLAASTGEDADISAVRRYRSGYGLSFNVEQQLAPNIGMFVRGGMRSGDVEPYEFSDIDRTLAAGLAVTGTDWGRPFDTIGFAGVINDISRQHRRYLDAGGLGILVGDGRLPNPGPEKILEAYYSLPIGSLARLTLDYQFVTNPAYNRDRGPVSILGGRLRLQF
ncbi:carbohydrate porin [Methylobacterium sp. ID0610]|uniref:carbohydrate porin n=1 Tax=Methylobacterium carpenticola TaxID=3344827 RepID=UPI00369ED530